LVKRTSYEAPHTIFSNLLPFHSSRVQTFSSTPRSQIPSFSFFP
jgi:hypothetical protein